MPVEKEVCVDLIHIQMDELQLPIVELHIVLCVRNQYF
jgi:hypothetical protein